MQAIAEKYYQEQKECAGFDNAEKYAEADAACQKALATANQLTDSLYDDERLFAYHFVSHVAYKLNRGTEALEDAREEIKFVGDATPLRNVVISRLDLARAYDLSGQPTEAEAEYQNAEKRLAAWKQESQGYEKVDDQERKKSRAEDFARATTAIREGHVNVLCKLHRDAEADALEKAAKD